MAILHGPAFEAYAVACFFLIALFYYLAFHTGTVRQKARSVVNPEDVVVYVGASVVEIENPEVQRVKRAHQNLIENAVPFFVVGLLYALTEPSPIIAGLLYAVFVASRILHTAMYLGRRQPVRSASWMIGVLDVGVMAALVAWKLVVA